MFFKKIPKWKIKRFLKRILRAIIFFALFSCLTFGNFCFGAVNNNLYDNWKDIVDDSKTYFETTNTSSQVNGPWNLRVNDDGYYYFSSGQRFTEIQGFFQGGLLDNPYNRGDIFLFGGNFKLRFSSSTEVTTESFDWSSLTFNIYYTPTNGLRDSFVVSMDDIHYVKGRSVTKVNSNTYDVTVEYRIEQTFQSQGNLNSLMISVSNLSGIQYVSFYPAKYENGQGILFYIGQSSTAPSYNAPDTTTKDKLVNDEDAIYDSANVDTSKSFLTNFFEGDGVDYIIGGLVGATTVVNKLINSIPFFNALCTFLLGIGCVAFILNIAEMSVRAIDRKERREQYRNYKRGG